MEAVLATASAIEVVALEEAKQYSLIELFMLAGPVVKGVMAILVIASIWSWAVVFDKQLLFGKLRSQANKFEKAFWSGRSLDDLAASLGHDPSDPHSRVFAAAIKEWRDARARGRESNGMLNLGERIDRIMALVVNREVASAERGLGVLASVGSASPFIGLFGTVWGIMNSFRAVAVAEDVNLAILAPGLAEALFATALGLFAAIPAVIFYNKYSADAATHAERLEGFSHELSAILAKRTPDTRSA